MGKKSVMDNPMLPSPNGQGVDALEVAMSPERNGLGDLFQEVLRVALQAQVDTEESRSKNQVRLVNVPKVWDPLLRKKMKCGATFVTDMMAHFLF